MLHLEIEKLRCDAYHSIRDIKKLKELKEIYIFWAEHGPKEYLESWKATLNYCQVHLTSLGQK
jgi:hypothetical protein